MNTLTKIRGFAFGALALGMMFSCSDNFGGLDLDYPVPGHEILRDADIIAWSGDQLFGNSFGSMETRSVAPGVIPSHIMPGSNESNDVKAFFTAQDAIRANETPVDDAPNGEFLTIDEAFKGWTDYWVQTVKDQYVESQQYFNVIANIGIWDYFDKSWKINKWTESGNEYFGSEHFKLIYPNDVPHPFNNAVKFENFPIVDFSYTVYLENKWSKQLLGDYAYIFGREPASLRNGENPAYRIAKIDGYDGIYVAFYAQTLDYDQLMNQGSGDPTTKPDWGDDKWDLIIKLTRIEEPEPNHENEVEVNFSINDKHTDPNGANYDTEDLVSKLSIHVRYPGDVEIFIPVGPEYYCAVDDLDIRTGAEFIEPLDSDKTVSYSVGGNTVTLTVRYESDGIHVTTSGINEAVMDYCWTNYGDGINFEVYNYFAKNKLENGEWVRDADLDIDDLQDRFNKSTIKFLGNVGPDYYINAFGYEYVNGEATMEQKKNDCPVSIIDAQLGSYHFLGKPCRHLNATPFNYIYFREGVTPDKAHSGRGEE